MTDGFEAYNVEDQLNHKDSILEYYKKLIDIRKNGYHDILTYGKFIALPLNDDIVSYVREYQGERIAVLCNLSSFNQEYELDSVESVIINNREEYIPGILKPYQAIILYL